MLNSVFSSFQPQHKLHKLCQCGLVTSALLLLLTLTVNTAIANTITGVSFESSGSQVSVVIKGDASPNYDVFELFKPARVVVDVAEAKLADGASIEIPEESGIALVTKYLEGQPSKTRFEFTYTDLKDFNVQSVNNNIVLKFSSNKNGTEINTGTIAEDIKVVTSPTTTKVTLVASGKLQGYHYEALPGEGSSPPRLFIDVNDINGDKLLKEQKVGTILDKIRVAQRGSGIRIVFDASTPDMFSYQISENGNGIEVTFEEPQKGSPQDEISELIDQKAIAEKLPQVKPDTELEIPKVEKSTTETLADSFNFAGYNKERITVDFYKIDLHNVFRLLREISGANIVVDEAVSGSLTLALNDVPWDFALDIILNLKDLVKEERFNTIVILPKDKAFDWPIQAANNLSFETDQDVVLEQQQALVIQQKQQTSPELIKAKQLVQKGTSQENSENFETAVSFYEKALSLWPDNAKLANRIATIYLVYLRNNAAAAHFAKKALAIQSDNSQAALNAAIAHANMHENEQAQQFFDQAVNDNPTAESLLSYASFSEEHKNYEGALKLLDKHDNNFGPNLHSMLAAARILDKNNQQDLATQKYQTLLLSGLRIPSDLEQYIKGRVALSQPN